MKLNNIIIFYKYRNINDLQLYNFIIKNIFNFLTFFIK